MGAGRSQSWGRWAEQRRDWEEAATAFGYGLEAIDSLFRRQLARDEKETWLQQAQGLAADAAFALAKPPNPQLPRRRSSAAERSSSRKYSSATEPNSRRLSAPGGATSPIATERLPNGSEPLAAASLARGLKN